MAIGTGDAIVVFGTQDKVSIGTGTAAVSNGALSAGTDVIDWTNDDDAPLAMFVLSLYDLTGAATAGDTIDLYCKPLNMVDTTGDHQGPLTALKTIYLGSFLVDAVDPGASFDYYVLGPIALPNVKTSQECEFYIFNNLTTVGMSAGWELWATPISYGPHA